MDSKYELYRIRKKIILNQSNEDYLKRKYDSIFIIKVGPTEGDANLKLQLVKGVS